MNDFPEAPLDPRNPLETYSTPTYRTIDPYPPSQPVEPLPEGLGMGEVSLISLLTLLGARGLQMLGPTLTDRLKPENDPRRFLEAIIESEQKSRVDMTEALQAAVERLTASTDREHATADILTRLLESDTEQLTILRRLDTAMTLPLPDSRVYGKRGDTSNRPRINRDNLANPT